MVAKLPNQVIIEMAKRGHRIHHYLFITLEIIGFFMIKIHKTKFET